MNPTSSQNATNRNIADGLPSNMPHHRHGSNYELASDACSDQPQSSLRPHVRNDCSRQTERHVQHQPEIKINIHAQYSSNSNSSMASEESLDSPEYAFKTSFSLSLPFGIQNLLQRSKNIMPSMAHPWTSHAFCSDFLSADMVKFLTMCLLWYASSAVTNNLSKQILNEYQHPVTLTYVQFALVSICCAIAANVNIGFCQIRAPTIDILYTILPLALFQIFGHIFSSVAMSYVPVSFAHTIKALSPLFTIMLYRSIYKIMYTRRVYLSLVPLTMGVMLVCATEIKFHVIGFLCALASTFVFVVQNVVSKKLFNDSSSKVVSTAVKIDKLNMLFYSSSMAFILMFPIWAYDEAPAFFNSDTDPLSFRLYTLFALNGISQFVQSVLAFWILSLTSPITYSIASLVKRIFVITASIIYFRDKVSITQAAGICLTFFGLWLYNEAKREVARTEAKISAIHERRASHHALPTRNPTEKDLDVR